MNVQSASERQEVQTADLAAGEFFSARIGETEVLAIPAEQGEDRFGVVLSHRGQDADLAAFPPPAGRLSTLGFLHLKFTGRAIARPTIEIIAFTPRVFLPTNRLEPLTTLVKRWPPVQILVRQQAG